MTANDEEIRRLSELLDEKQLKEMQEAYPYFERHDKEEALSIRCPGCGSDFLIERCALKFHAHAPLGMYVDEVYECSKCFKYVQVIYRYDKTVIL